MIRIDHAAWGHSVNYELNDHGIYVFADGDRGDQKFRKAFSRDISTGESEEIYQFLKNLNLDTLKPAYIDSNLRDGSDIHITVRAEGLALKKVHLYGRSTNVTNSLIAKMDSMVPDSVRTW